VIQTLHQKDLGLLQFFKVSYPGFDSTPAPALTGPWLGTTAMLQAKFHDMLKIANDRITDLALKGVWSYHIDSNSCRSCCASEIPKFCLSVEIIT